MTTSTEPSHSQLNETNTQVKHQLARVLRQKQKTMRAQNENVLLN